MRRRVLVIIGCVACGSNPPPTATEYPLEPSPSEAATVQARREPLSDADACKRLRELRDEGCMPFASFPAARFGDACEVVGDIHHNNAAECLAEPTCDAVNLCMHDGHERLPAYVGPTRPCKLPAGDPGLAFPAGSGVPAGPPRGANDKIFADSSSMDAPSPDNPIEVCTIHGIARYFGRVTCKDGSKPWKTGHVAIESGAMLNLSVDGGRCGRKLSVWIAPCPEGRYVVPFDSMFCPDGGPRP